MGALVALIAACDHTGSVAQASEVRTTASHSIRADSIRRADLLRFRAGLDSPAVLAGAATREQLLQSFFTALRGGDRHALESLAITRAEFAYLVFPDSKWAKPPYNQPPHIEWLLLSQQSESGLTRLLRRAPRFELVSHACSSPPELDGAVRYWPGCLVRVRDSGQVRDLKLFGAIVEIGGRYKFRDFNNGF